MPRLLIIWIISIGTKTEEKTHKEPKTRLMGGNAHKWFSCFDVNIQKIVKSIFNITSQSNWYKNGSVHIYLAYLYKECWKIASTMIGDEWLLKYLWLKMLLKLKQKMKKCSHLTGSWRPIETKMNPAIWHALTMSVNFKQIQWIIAPSERGYNKINILVSVGTILSHFEILWHKLKN